MKKSNLMPSVVLGSICIVVALLLSVVNMITGPVIEAARDAASNAALLEVLPNGKNFRSITLTDEYPDSVVAGYSADGGFVFQMSVTGKEAGLVIMCGIDGDGRIVGTKVISNKETPSYAEKVFPGVEGKNGAYAGMNLDTFAPALVSGATLTSKAYGEAVKAALQSAILAAGGSVDTRTPEQILQDNCNAALGTQGRTFTKWFAVEIIEGVDAVYKTAEGSVYVIGESFIGITAQGAVITSDASAENIAKATAADTVIKSSVLTEVTDLPTGVSEDIQKVFVTNSGNYLIEVLGKGYKYERNVYYDVPDDGRMSIMVSISEEGRIIDVITLSHKESKGYGDKCATEEYYKQFIGATDDDIVISADRLFFDIEDYHMDLIDEECTEIGALSGATYTTVGYQEAIKASFKAIDLITGAEGGND